MICVIATIEVAESRREDFLTAFTEIMPEVHEEKGCIEYGPMLDVPTNIPAQPDVRDNVVTIVEKWESLDSLEAHLMAPHMLEYRKKVKDIVTSTRLQILQPA